MINSFRNASVTSSMLTILWPINTFSTAENRRVRSRVIAKVISARQNMTAAVT